MFLVAFLDVHNYVTIVANVHSCNVAYSFSPTLYMKYSTGRPPYRIIARVQKLNLGGGRNRIYVRYVLHAIEVAHDACILRY